MRQKINESLYGNGQINELAYCTNRNTDNYVYQKRTSQTRKQMYKNTSPGSL